MANTQTYPQYVMIEASRQSLPDESVDGFKNKWKNEVPEGIQVNKGDSISVEASFIHTRGADQQLIELTGNQTGAADNIGGFELVYFLNNTGQFTARLPFINTVVDIGNGAKRPTSGAVDPKVLKNRRCGSLLNGSASNVITNGYFIQHEYTNGVPLGSYVQSSAHPYSVGQVVRMVNVSDSAQLIFIEIDNIGVDNVSNPSTPVRGSITKFHIQSFSSNIQPGTYSDQSSSGGFQFSCEGLNTNFKSRYPNGSDGHRYYFPETSYTGWGLVSDGVCTSYGTLNPEWSPRTTEVSFTFDTGFISPDSIASQITAHLTNPSQPSNTFATARNYNLKLKTTGSNTTKLTTPLLLETPTYQLMTCNFSADTQSFGELADFPTNILAPKASQLYNNIGYKDYGRWRGLSFVKTLPFAQTDSHQHTFFSGKNPVPALGDFGNQTLGDFGLNIVSMTTFPTTQTTVDDSTVDWISVPAKSLIVTNLYYTQGNVKRLAEAFKMCEQYKGNLAQTVDTGSANYRENTFVRADVGMYDDEQSLPVLNPNEVPTVGGALQATFQRKALHTLLNIGSSTLVSTAIDNKGQPIPSRLNYTSGDDYSKSFNCLPELDIYSRWDDSFESLGTMQTFVSDHKASTSYFRCPPTVNQAFRSGDKRNKIDYSTLIGYSKTYDVAILPVQAVDGYAPGVGVMPPLCCFILRNSFGTPPQRTSGHAQVCLRSQLFSVGERFLFDPSLTRNDAVCAINIQTSGQSNVDETDPQKYAQLMYQGAANPQIEFDSVASRFNISGLSTLMTVGNGLNTNPNSDDSAEDDPSQTVAGVNKSQQICSEHRYYLKYNDSSSVSSYVGIWSTLQYAAAIKQTGTYYDAQSGVGIQSIIVSNNGVNVKLDGTGSTEASLYKGSLFDKMGFELSQLIPQLGSPNGVYQQLPPTSYAQALSQPKPVTIGARFSSPELLAVTTNVNGLPMYSIGVDTGTAVEPDISADNLVASNLPAKTDYPNLVVYTDILNGASDTLYYGGRDQVRLQKLNAIAYVERCNLSGDFFYGNAMEQQHTITKDFILTDITTELRLPDGSAPRLAPASCIMYKITKPIPLLLELAPPKQAGAPKAPSKKHKIPYVKQ